ncbi:hypothetical protein HZA99_01860 [Candidatus Woesearchaeota archaeon]|nr:hypothetical protein [Candidatus Woesearchaeota archaeon]
MKQISRHKFALMTSILFFAALILAVPAVFAGGLGFKDIDAEVDGEFDSGVNAAGGSFEAAPGDYVIITVKAENTFPVNTSGHRIRNVDARFRVDSTCPDNLDDKTEETISLEDLDPDSDDTATFRFTVPDCADEDNYDVEIRLKGKDKTDDTEYTVEETLQMTVNKDATALTLDFSQPDPATIDCDDRSFSVSVEAHNLGSITLDSGVLVISNDLGINKWDFIKLKPGRWTNEETWFTKNYTFTVADSIAPGDYDLRAEVEYEDGVRSEKRFQTVTVPDCSASEEESASENAEVETTNDDVDTVASTTSTVTAPAATETTTSEAVKTSAETTTPTDYTLPLLIGGLIIGLVVLGAMLAFLLKKK